MIKLLNKNNMEYTPDTYEKADLIIADYIYENLNFDWASRYWSFLKPGGIFVAITDYHSSAEFKVYMQSLEDSNFVNWLIWKNEFGNFRKDRFRQCHDDIIIFSKGTKYRFDPEKVQVQKVTAKAKKLNPSGRETKIATSVITDITLTTISKERVKKDDGKNIKWQKPKDLLRRISIPFLKKGDLVIDPFMGSGTMAEVCFEEGWHYIGVEYDKETFNIATKRLENFKDNREYIPF